MYMYLFVAQQKIKKNEDSLEIRSPNGGVGAGALYLASRRNSIIEIQPLQALHPEQKGYFKVKQYCAI